MSTCHYQVLLPLLVAIFYHVKHEHGPKSQNWTKRYSRRSVTSSPNPLPKGQTENTLHDKVKSRTAGCEIHNVWYPVKKQTNITQYQEKSDQ